MTHSCLDFRLSHTYVALEFVIDYEQLNGTQNVTIIKELSIAGESVLETFQFLSPYAMRPHRDTENGVKWTMDFVFGPERIRGRLPTSVSICRFEMYFDLTVARPTRP